MTILIPPRVHDLGGFQVRRAVPSLQARSVGPFVFVDHMGPAHFEAGHGVDVRPQVFGLTAHHLKPGAWHKVRDQVGDGAFRRLPPNRSADRQAVTRLVERAVLALSDPEGSGWREASRELYDLLIKPIEGELKPGSVLAVVPDGPLRALPFY